MKNNAGGQSINATMTVYEDLEGEVNVNGTIRSFRAQKSGNKLVFYLNKPNIQNCFNYKVGCEAKYGRDRSTLSLQCRGTECKGKPMNWKGVFTK